MGCSRAEILVEGHLDIGALLHHQAWCAFDLHEEPPCVDGSGTHVVPVRGEIHLHSVVVFGASLDVVVDVVDRGVDHREEFVIGECLSEFPCIRKGEGHDSRNVRTSHGCALHVAVFSLADFLWKGGEDLRPLRGCRSGVDGVVSSRCTDVGSRTEVGVVGRKVVRAEGSHGDVSVVGCRVGRDVLAFVAGREDGEVAAYRVARRRVGHEVVEGVGFEAVEGLEVGIRKKVAGILSERTLEDACSHVCRIFIGLGAVECAAARVAREELTGHHAYACVRCTVTSGHSADSYAVVVDSSHGAGHMGSVTVVPRP